MAVEEHFLRSRIVALAQHPLKHSAGNIGYVNPAMPGVVSMGGAINYLSAVLFPRTQATVATVADLPPGGNTINDYRIVTDDGDGKAAGYRWYQREGDAAAGWWKVADFDWSADQIVAGMYDRTLFHFVHKWGFDDTDDDGVAFTGVRAGQHIYGGSSAGTHLTLHANSGDGVGLQSGYIQLDDPLRPVADSTVSLGTSAERWLKVWSDELTVGTTTVIGGTISDSSGTISFDNENLQTTGSVLGALFFAGNGIAADPSFSFMSDDDLGFYRVGADELGVASGGVRVASFGAAWLDLVAGSAPTPSFRFAGDVDSGLYSPGANQVGFATAGVQRLLLGSDGKATFGDTDLVVDVANDRVGMGIAVPLVGLHLFKAGQPVFRIEGQNSTPANGSAIQLYRSRAAGANLAVLDDVSYLDTYGMVAGAYVWLSGQQTRYRGDGTTQSADIIWSTAYESAPVEMMRLRYDGNLGIGVSDPDYQLHVAGSAAVGNVYITGSGIASISSNSDLDLGANGSGHVSLTSNLRPNVDNVTNLGAVGAGFATVFLGTGISNGTTSISSATLQSLRDINVAASSGMTLFYDGSKWNPSIPNTEIDHGTITGLGDDDHSQYLLLLGRSGGQTAYGGTASGDDLWLRSTSHVTKGNVFIDSVMAPTADGTIDLGATGVSFKDFWVSGQLYGARLQNATTAARPAASAGTKGRLIYDTDLEDVYIDRGGTWKKTSIEKYVTQDAVGWNGSATSVAYTVSSECSDARECVWVFKANADTFKQILCDITMTQTTVTVTVDIPLAAGTYTLVGVG